MLELIVQSASSGEKRQSVGHEELECTPHGWFNSEKLIHWTASCLRVVPEQDISQGIFFARHAEETASGKHDAEPSLACGERPLLFINLPPSPFSNGNNTFITSDYFHYFRYFHYFYYFCYLIDYIKFLLTILVN